MMKRQRPATHGIEDQMTNYQKKNKQAVKIAEPTSTKMTAHGKMPPVRAKGHEKGKGKAKNDGKSQLQSGKAKHNAGDGRIRVKPAAKRNRKIEKEAKDEDEDEDKDTLDKSLVNKHSCDEDDDEEANQMCGEEYADGDEDNRVKRKSSSKKCKKTYQQEEENDEEEEDDQYEGPVDEHSSDEDDDISQDDDSDDDESDDDGKIELDGALRRGTEDAAGVEGMSEQEIVNINLDFCDPNERFFHGVRALISNSYLQDAVGAGLSPLVDLAMAQGAVGTVLSSDSEDDNDVFAFITALPLRYLAQGNDCVKAIIKYLLNKAKQAGRGQEMEAVIGKGAKGKVGLLVNERMINCPMQAVPKLHEALAEDIAWAVENEISKEHRDKFRFDGLVVVARCDGGGGAAGASSSGTMLSDFIFDRFDDEVLLQEADFFFPMRSAGPSGHGSSASGDSSAEGSTSGRRYIVGFVASGKHKESVNDIVQMVS